MQIKSSPQFSMNEADWKHVLKAMLYSATSSALTALTVFLTKPDLMSWKAMIVVVGVPTMNGALVALKKFVDGEPFTKPKRSKD